MRDGRRLGALLGAVAAVTGAAWGETDARACGGCIAPQPPPNLPDQTVSQITAERMIFSVSPEQTTLYDEINFSGSPASFAWVLPIKGTATIGLSADILFASLDTLTASQVVPPPLNCPPPACTPSGGGGAGCAFGGSSGSITYAGPSGAFTAADAGAAGVTVTHQEQVGPYETVQLASTDPTALDRWLAAHGYVLPPSDAPVVAAYVHEGFGFLAMKLVPGQGVKAMRPVRVTTPGAGVTLPLRMVGVGTGATTGVTLWVIGDARWEPANFPSFILKDSELTWTWSTSSSNYEAVRLQHESVLHGAGWQIESSLELNESTIRSTVEYADATGTSATDYLPIAYVDGGVAHDAGARKDASARRDANAQPDTGVSSDASGRNDGRVADTGIDAAGRDGSLAEAGSSDARVVDGQSRDAHATDAPSNDVQSSDAAPGDSGGGAKSDAEAYAPPESAAQVEQDDLTTLFKGMKRPNVRVTRMRADLAHHALSADLTIQPASDQTELSNLYNPAQILGEPLCPIYDQSCNQIGEAPRSQAGASTSSGCSTTAVQTSLGSQVITLGCIGIVGGGMLRSRRKRRARKG